MKEPDRELMLSQIVNKSLRYYQPIVRLTPHGIRNLGNGEVRYGRLRGIKNGMLRVRFFGCKTWSSYHPMHWEFAPRQIDEREGVN